MKFKIEVQHDYLRVVMAGRHTAVENRAAARAILEALERHRLSKILVSIRQSRAIFKVEEYRLSDIFERFAAIPGLKVALVSDSQELYASHQYIELLASQRGLAYRAFRDDERSAINWLSQGAASPR